MLRKLRHFFGKGKLHNSAGEGKNVSDAQRLSLFIQKIERANHRMEHSTDSQLAVLVDRLSSEIGEGAGAGTSMQVDMLLAWRKKRGDFDYDDKDKEEVEEQAGFAGDEVPQLTSDMEGVTESIMHLGFLKSDLQFECLLRNIPYEGSDSKGQLILKLMHFKEHTLFRDCQTFQILESECS